MNNGFVMLHRQITEWEWYKDPVVSRVFFHLILKANHQQNKWQNLLIRRGQLVTGRKVLALELGITEQNVRTAWNKLKSTNEITIESTNKFSLITIVNYDVYQGKVTNKSTKKLTNNQPTTNQQLTTNNNVNNINNEDNINKEEGETLKKANFSSLKDLTPSVIEEIAEKYECPIEFVNDCLDNLTNYCEAHGKKYKNYKSALINFVKNDRKKLVEGRLKNVTRIAKI